jgi:hypothetical protein
MHRREVAYHEAGHAVAHILYGHPVDEITVKPDPEQESLGHVKSVYGGIIQQHCLADDGLQMEMVRQIVRAIYAGLAAQRLFNARAGRGGADQDYWQAAELADEFCLGNDVQRWHRRQIAAAQILVKEHRAAVSAIADALCKRKTLAPAHARAIVRMHAPRVPEVIDYSKLCGEFWEQESVAELLRVSPDTLARWRRQGRGPTFLRIGRYVRYHVVPAPEGSSTMFVVDDLTPTR